MTVHKTIEAETKTQTMTGAQMVVQALIDQGVDVLFGYPGGAVLPIYDALFHDQRLKHVLVRHEQGAAHDHLRAGHGFGLGLGVGFDGLVDGHGLWTWVSGMKKGPLRGLGKRPMAARSKDQAGTGRRTSTRMARKSVSPIGRQA